MSGVAGEAEAAGWAAAATLGYMVCDLLTQAAVRRLRPPPEEQPEADQAQLAGHTASPPTPPDGADRQLTAGGADDTDGTDAPSSLPSEYRHRRQRPVSGERWSESGLREIWQ